MVDVCRLPEPDWVPRSARRLPGVAPHSAIGRPPSAYALPRASSSPALERTLPFASGDSAPSAETEKLCRALECASPLPSARPSTAPSVGRPLSSRRSRQPWAQDRNTLPERSDQSTERYRDDCLRLKSELADRREETRQLQQRVRLLEGSLQVRMTQMEALTEELRRNACADQGAAACPSCGRGGRNLADLLERLIGEARRTQVVLHSHADTGAAMEAKDRLLEQAEHDRQQQVHLMDQLHESRIAGKRLAAKVREHSNEHGGLKQRLEQVRRSARKQDELLAAYENSHQELSERMQAVAARLEEERRARREQELTAQKLAVDLQEARLQLAHSSAPEPGPRAEAHRVGWMSAAPVAGQKDEEGGGSASTLRLEHQRLREEERAQRRQRRGLPPRTDAVEGRTEVQRALSEALAEAEGARFAEREAREAECIAREEGEACRRELEVARLELSLESEAQGQWRALAEQAESEELHLRSLATEHRASALAEVANEVAYQADLRQLKTLQDEVHLQKAVSDAELRCSMLAAIVNQAAVASAAAVAAPAPHAA